MATTVITNYQAIASTIAALGGTSGLQFRATATHLQWKTADTEWTNLVSLAEIGGTDFSLIEWQVSATHLQWRFDGIHWVDVIALSALGVTDGITSLTPEAGKIPLAGEDGKIAPEWVRDVVTTTTGPGGGSRIPAGPGGLLVPAVLQQEPHRPWPAVRPAYEGPITLIGWSAAPPWAGHYDTYINVTRLAPQLYTDFSGYPVGAAPADWVPAFHAGAVLRVIATAGAVGGRELRFTESSDPASQRNAAIWSAGPADATDVEVLMEVRDAVGSTSAMGPGILLRADPTVTGANARGYGVFFRGGAATNAIRIMRYDVAATELGVQTFTPTLGATPTLMRARIQGSTISAKIWARDLAEPVDWMITRTDETHAFGSVGIMSNNKAIDCKIDRIAFAFNGATAAFPA